MLEGRILGDRYKITEKIGSGGMATVYRGTDNVLGRTVAVKVMLPQYAQDPTFAARFRQEAQAAANLTSPYIVNIYDWGQDGDTYYIVMEYLRGTDLKMGIKTHGPLATRKVAQIAAQVCAALAVAHRHEVIHRDIKPQNIMIQPDGSAKVMDFGIARSKNSHLTQTNSVLGTAHYVSPEQTQGKELGPESDLYSLGIVMYEASTGRVPFEGDEAVSVALKQVNEKPVPPSKYNPKIDAEFEAIIMKLLNKRPEDRFKSADELRRVLNNYIAGRPTGLAPVGAYSSSQDSTTVMPRAQDENNATRTMVRPQAMTQVGGAANSRRIPYDLYDEPAEKRTVWPIIVGIILALVAVGIILFVLFRPSGTDLATIPDVVGQDQVEATRLLTEQGFDIGSVSSDFSEEVAEGLIVDQDPDGGLERPRGTKINLVISKGPEPEQAFDVPNITGKTEAEAKQILTNAGLVPQAGEPVNDDNVPAGTIVSQSPAVGSKVVEGDTVVYSVSLGTEMVKIPDVTGQSLDTARVNIESANLKVEVVEEHHESVPSGSVIATRPDAGTELAVGSMVTIVVSKGVEEVTIPNVVGMGESAAKATLEARGLTVEVTYTQGANSELGLVVDQDPTGKIAPGSTVAILVVNETVQPIEPPAPPEEPEPDEGNGDNNGENSENSGNGNN